MKLLASYSMAFFALTVSAFVFAVENATLVEPITSTKHNPVCVDGIASIAIVDPTLDSDFFRSNESSYPSHIIEHTDGHLENTTGDPVSPEEAVKSEHTAKCLSSHQGEHLMSYCDAEQVDGGLLLELAGGLPAYASSLTLRIDKDKNLKCRFVAVYPMTVHGEELTWTITKKSFKMTSDHFKADNRLLGWLSVEFEETSTIDSKVTTKSHKIEGYVKPIIKKQSPDSKSNTDENVTDRPLPVAGFR